MSSVNVFDSSASPGRGGSTMRSPTRGSIASSSGSPSASMLGTRNSPRGGGAGSGANKDFDPKQHTIDVLTQELLGTRAAAKRAQEEVALLRHQLGVMRAQGAPQLRTDKPRTEETWILFCRSVLALQKSPNSTVLQSLHDGQDIEVPRDCDFVQMSALAEATRVSRPHVRRMTVDLHESSHAPFIMSTLDSLSSLQEFSCSRANDGSISVAVHALSAHPELEVIELNNLMIGDNAAQLLRKTLSERSVLAEAGAASRLQPFAIDLAESYFKEPAKFNIFGGNVESLAFTNQKFFTFNEVRTCLESCSSWLTNLSVAGTMCDNRICTLLDSLPHVVELDVTNCQNITHLNLKHVTHLHTDGRRIVEYNCPSLVSFQSPLQHFAPAAVKLPKIEEMSFLNATLTRREMELLGQNCNTVLNAKLLGCRVESLDLLLRQWRSLRTLSLHSCKGVRDTDVSVLFDPLVELDLTDNFVLTDAVVDGIARCPHLEKLSLKRCQNISDVGVAKLEGHPTLRFLNVLGTKKVSAAAVQRLVRAGMEQNGFPVDIRHATAISADTMIERDDDEEKERENISRDERNLLNRKSCLSTFASSTASPVSQSPSRLAAASRSSARLASSSRGGSLAGSLLVAANGSGAAATSSSQRPTTQGGNSPRSPGRSSNAGEL